MKPILFNTEMVRAILADRKTVTRRVVKGYALDHLELDTDGSIIGAYNQDEGCVFPIMDYAPYRPGDILYVRETWTVWDRNYEYKADVDDGYGPFCSNCTLDICAGDCNSALKWRPSIHMPREAARIFLRVTDVRVERLHDITWLDALKAGCERPSHFDELWNSTIKKADRSLYGWKANPWVWVIEFERCEKPKGD